MIQFTETENVLTLLYESDSKVNLRKILSALKDALVNCFDFVEETEASSNITNTYTLKNHPLCTLKLTAYTSDKIDFNMKWDGQPNKSGTFTVDPILPSSSADTHVIITIRTIDSGVLKSIGFESSRTVYRWGFSTGIFTDYYTREQFQLYNFTYFTGSSDDKYIAMFPRCTSGSTSSSVYNTTYFTETSAYDLQGYALCGTYGASDDKYYMIPSFYILYANGARHVLYLNDLSTLYTCYRNGSLSTHPNQKFSIDGHEFARNGVASNTSSYGSNCIRLS